MRTYKDDDAWQEDDMNDPDEYGNPVRLSRDNFNRIMEWTLRAMGDEDPEQVWDHRPEWDDEYDRMKYFTSKQFKDICSVGVKNYNHSKKAGSN